MSRRSPFGRPPRLVKGFIFLGLIVALAFLLGGAVMWLWNAILPDVTGVQPLTYWQALGLLVLSRILFGGFRWGGPGGAFREKRRRWKEKWAGMSEEERARFREKWRERCGRKE